MNSNPLVDFLAAYGPQASSNNLYDEFVVEAAARTGCAALQIDQPLTVELIAMLQSTAPRCVILSVNHSRCANERYPRSAQPR